MPTETNQTPYEIDMQIAELYYAADKVRTQINRVQETIKQYAGAEYEYIGRRWATRMSFEEACTQLQQNIAHSQTEGSYTLLGVRSHIRLEDALGQFPKLEQLQNQLAQILSERASLEQLYTGWSRFFLVTSSSGHIHSSMNCSSCRPTTAYAWLPELSGQSEIEAVAGHGPALCSVCFESAPVDYVGGKISQSDAEMVRDSGKSLAIIQAERHATANAKVIAKAATLTKQIERQHTQALKVDTLLSEFGRNSAAAYKETWDGGKYAKGYSDAYFIYSRLVEKLD